MTFAATEESIRNRARSLLREIHSRKGRPKDIQSFYPVDPANVIETCLEWQLEETGEMGFTKIGERLTAKCDFARRRITYDGNALKNGEKAYALAHEIGHALL